MSAKQTKKLASEHNNTNNHHDNSTKRTSKGTASTSANNNKTNANTNINNSNHKQTPSSSDRSRPMADKQHQRPHHSNNGQMNDSSAQEHKRSPKRSHGGSNESSAELAKKLPELNQKICSTLDEFSAGAQQLKAEIKLVLERQTSRETNEQPVEVMQLRENILDLSKVGICNRQVIDTHQTDASPTTDKTTHNLPDTKSLDRGDEFGADSAVIGSDDTKSGSLVDSHSRTNERLGSTKEDGISDNAHLKSSSEIRPSDNLLTEAINNLVVNDDKVDEPPKLIKTTKPSPKKQSSATPQGSVMNAPPPTPLSATSNASPNFTSEQQEIINSNGFEPLDAKLDPESKLIALQSSLQKHFVDVPHLLKPICLKLIDISERNNQLCNENQSYQLENKKLTMVKQKLENLCRELQKSNSAIRIESLDLIKAEQIKAKEQTAKIQSTLPGVMKLFDENQQRNMSLRQENLELQSRLKSLLEHCDNWEKSVETALKQRDIENRLLKTELAKANLLRNEEREKFLKEKQELLQLLAMMQEQQHKIEGQEAKLRSDLSSYASKYDECQAVISKGMNKFQTESKRMLKQLEKSKQDYIVLLSKYENSNKKIAQLLEEKQHWSKTALVANKKIETLERLCRALSERKLTDSAGGGKEHLSGNKSGISADECKGSNDKEKESSSRQIFEAEGEGVS